MPDTQVIQVPELKTIGPYSQAVRAAGLLFVSGQPGVDPSTGEAVGPTFDVSRILMPFCGRDAAGSTWS